MLFQMMAVFCIIFPIFLFTSVLAVQTALGLTRKWFNGNDF